MIRSIFISAGLMALAGIAWGAELANSKSPQMITVRVNSATQQAEYMTSDDVTPTEESKWQAINENEVLNKIPDGETQVKEESTGFLKDATEAAPEKPDQEIQAPLMSSRAPLARVHHHFGRHYPYIGIYHYQPYYYTDYGYYYYRPCGYYVGTPYFYFNYCRWW